VLAHLQLGMPQVKQQENKLQNLNVKYKIFTLIDITNTKVITPKANPVGFHQEQNFNTFIQILSLRTQVISNNVKKIKKAKYNSFNFGSAFDGSGPLWELTFIAEATVPWIKDEDLTYWLYRDFDNIPVHIKLNEKENIYPESISTVDSLSKNTCFITEQIG